jgi:hypothetical protein
MSMRDNGRMAHEAAGAQLVRAPCGTESTPFHVPVTDEDETSDTVIDPVLAK